MITGRKSLIILLLLLLGGISTMYLVIPVLSVRELVYPVRKDSLYLHNLQFMKRWNPEKGDSMVWPWLYNPGQVGLPYRATQALTADGDSLSWWTLHDPDFSTGHHLIVIPDWNESRLDYIEFADEVTGRGLFVTLADMRGQGASGGKKYIPSGQSVGDVSLIIDSLQSLYSVAEVAVFGCGTGAAIALQAAQQDDRIAVLILEKPFLDQEDFIRNHAKEKYGKATDLFLHRLLIQYRKETGLYPSDLNMLKWIADYLKPVLFIDRNNISRSSVRPAHILFRTSRAVRKKWMVRPSDEAFSSQTTERKKYFDRLATFVHTNLLPPGQQKLPYKPIALDL
jgi:alpha-beta hydrolase superfamily lysophospholipase